MAKNKVIESKTYYDQLLIQCQELEHYSVAEIYDTKNEFSARLSVHKHFPREQTVVLLYKTILKNPVDIQKYTTFLLFVTTSVEKLAKKGYVSDNVLSATLIHTSKRVDGEF